MKHSNLTENNLMKPLDKENFNKVTVLVRQVTINNLFARSIVEQKVTGRIFVDDTDNPSTAYFIHPYGMTLLTGDAGNQAFNEWFRNYALNTTGTRTTHEWMQAWPDNWDRILPALFADRLIKSADNITYRDKGIIELNTRVNFRFNKEKFLASRKPVTDTAIRIVQTDRSLFRTMQGSVIPASFWDTEDDFFKHGLGYSLLYNEQLAAIAFSSFWFDDQFELGIETVPAFRGKGLAEIVCAALLDYCIQNNLEPIWACRLENTGSYKLALKLGFEVAATIPYYRLSN